jgi:hypothetical protein
MSNFAYSQTKISEYLSFYFAAIGVGSSICASEINNYYNEDDENKEHVITLLIIANVSTFFLSNIYILYNINVYSCVNNWELSDSS